MDFFNNAVLFRHYVVTTDPTPEELATLLYATTPEVRARVYGYIRNQPDLVDVESLYVGAAAVCAGRVFLSLQATFVLDPAMHDNAPLRAVCNHRTALVNPLVIVNSLLQGVDPSVPEQRPLMLACAHGHVSIVRRLVQDVRVDAGYHDNTPLTIAASNGQLQVVQMLMMLRRVRDVGSYDDALMNAIRGGHTNVVRHILRTAPVILISRRMIHEAAQNVDILDALLSHDPSVRVEPRTLLNAISRDRLDIIQLVMEKYGYRVVNTAIQAAASSNALKIMRYFIYRHHDVFVPRQALTYATEEGHAAMVSLILETPNVDIPSNILLTAILNNRGAAADVLLSDKRVFLLPQSIKIACGARADRVVWALLRHGIKARPEYLSYAIAQGDYATTYVLIRYGALVPTAADVHAARDDESVLYVILNNDTSVIPDDVARRYQLQAESDTITELWRQYREEKKKKKNIKQPIQVQHQVWQDECTTVRCSA